MSDADEAVLDVAETSLMNPKVVERALAIAEAEIDRDGTARKREALAAELVTCEKEVENLTTAIKRRGGSRSPPRCNPCI